MRNKIIIVALLFSIFQLSSKAQSTWGDYTLVAKQNATSAILIDMAKATYHTWNFTGGGTTYSCYVLPGGDLVRSVSHSGNSFTGGPISGEVQKVDWNGNILWDYVYSTTTYCTHHDICPLPNGNVLLISYESKTKTEVDTAGCSFSNIMWPDKIVEVQPTGATTGTIVWEWHAWDHLCQSMYPTRRNYVSNVADHPELMNVNYKSAKDWMHMNGVDYNAALDQITFSSHNLNEIYVIDHSTTTAEAASHTGGNAGKGGDILYRWGNPAAYSASGTAYINVVHDAHWVPADCPRAGYLVGFNNKGISSPQTSVVDMVSPPMSGGAYVTPASGSAFGPSIYNKRIVTTGYTSNMGNSQQLPNGNSLICVALSGSIYEVDSNSTTIWSYSAGGGVPQSTRYTACYISGTQPGTPTITQNGSSLICDSTGTTYQWYLNGVAVSGATAQSYTPTQSGSYQVKVINASNCGSLLSSAFSFTAAGISIVDNEKYWRIFPNPSATEIYLQTQQTEVNYNILSIEGKVIQSVEKWNTTQPILINNLNNGVYMIQLKSIDNTKHFGTFKFSKI
ncbi:MAG: hypothetical protein RL065_742 [Bacteroidota bacterium]|jgi:hypothetical protein